VRLSSWLRGMLNCQNRHQNLGASPQFVAGAGYALQVDIVMRLIRVTGREFNNMSHFTDDIEVVY